MDEKFISMIEIIKLSGESQEERDKYYMQNLKYDINEVLYKTKIDLQTENKLMATKGERKRRNKLGGCIYHINTTIYKVDSKQGPIV